MVSQSRKIYGLHILHEMSPVTPRGVATDFSRNRLLSPDGGPCTVFFETNLSHLDWGAIRRSSLANLTVTAYLLGFTTAGDRWSDLKRVVEQCSRIAPGHVEAYLASARRLARKYVFLADALALGEKHRKLWHKQQLVESMELELVLQRATSLTMGELAIDGVLAASMRDTLTVAMLQQQQAGRATGRGRSPRRDWPLLVTTAFLFAAALVANGQLVAEFSADIVRTIGDWLDIPTGR